MVKFAADENFNYDIVRGLQRREPDLDIVRIQEVGLSGVDDPAVLEWAASENRVLLTHDRLKPAASPGVHRPNSTGAGSNAWG